MPQLAGSLEARHERKHRPEYAIIARLHPGVAGQLGSLRVPDYPAKWSNGATSTFAFPVVEFPKLGLAISDLVQTTGYSHQFGHVLREHLWHGT
jgi:hypothetical protein